MQTANSNVDSARGMSLLSRTVVLLVLTAGYYVGLGLMPMITYRLPIMDVAEWLGASQSTASYAYLIGTHTIGVFVAALPIAFVVILVFPSRPYWIALLVSLPPLVDLAFAIWMFGGIGHASFEFTVFYITDGLKIILAIPLLAWLLSSRLPRNRHV